MKGLVLRRTSRLVCDISLRALWAGLLECVAVVSLPDTTYHNLTNNRAAPPLPQYLPEVKR